MFIGSTQIGSGFESVRHPRMHPVIVGAGNRSPALIHLDGPIESYF